MKKEYLILIIIAVLLGLVGLWLFSNKGWLSVAQFENLIRQVETPSSRDFSPEGLVESESLGQTGDPEADRELDAIETELKTTDSKAFEADF